MCPRASERRPTKEPTIERKRREWIGRGKKSSVGASEGPKAGAKGHRLNIGRGAKQKRIEAKRRVASKGTR